MRLLYYTREPFPTHRVDIEELFGREMSGRGHVIDLVAQAAAGTSTGPQPWAGGTAWVGSGSRLPGFLGRVLGQLYDFWHDLYALRLVQRQRYDALQVRDKFLIAALALPVARWRGVRFFFWLSFPMPEGDLLHARSGHARYPWATYLRGRFTGWLLYRWIVPHSDHVFVQSERLKADLSARGGPPEKMTAVPMGVSLGNLPAGHVPRSTRPTTVLGYLGTLDANRHLEILIDMLRDLREEGREVTLLLIGDAHDPRDRIGLEHYAVSRQVDAFLTITGQLPHRAALERIAKVDIALSPIHPAPIFLVGSPTKLVEYMALGLPVVANSHPEQQAMLRASRAGVCVPWGARPFARGVRWLMGREAGQLAQMGRNGRVWVEQHRAYGRIADDVERTYLQLLSSPDSLKSPG